MHIGIKEIARCWECRDYSLSLIFPQVTPSRRACGELASRAPTSPMSSSRAARSQASSQVKHHHHQTTSKPAPHPSSSSTAPAVANARWGWRLSSRRSVGPAGWPVWPVASRPGGGSFYDNSRPGHCTDRPGEWRADCGCSLASRVRCTRLPPSRLHPATQCRANACFVVL